MYVRRTVCTFGIGNENCRIFIAQWQWQWIGRLGAKSEEAQWPKTTQHTICLARQDFCQN